jgi:hypothetical protein
MCNILTIDLVGEVYSHTILPFSLWEPRASELSRWLSRPHLFLDPRADAKISASVQVARFYNANFMQFYVAQIMYKVVITFNKMVSRASFLTPQFPSAKWTTHENYQPQSSPLGNANFEVPTGTPSILPPSLPPAKVPTTLLRGSDLRGLLWPGIYHCNDLSM